MKNALLAVLAFIITNFLSAQDISLTWGESIDIKNGGAYTRIIMAGPSGLYMTKKMNVLILGGIKNNKPRWLLLKFDSNNKQLFEKDLSQKLKDYTIDRVEELAGELYVFCNRNENNNASYYGCKINNQTGEPGEPVLLSSMDFKESIEFSVKPSPDKKQWIVIRDESTKKAYAYTLILIGADLSKQIETTIKPDYKDWTYELEDAFMDDEKHWILVSKTYEIVSKGNRKFRQYSVTRYTGDGEKEREFPTHKEGIVILSAITGIIKPGILTFGGLYSKDNESGVALAEIDTHTGNLLTSTLHPFTTEMNFTAENSSKKGSDEKINVSGFVFKAIRLNPADQSTILIAEEFKYTNSRFTGASQWESSNKGYYETFGLLAINCTNDAKIKWVKLIPKFQQEVITFVSGPTNPPRLEMMHWLDHPLYSSFVSTVTATQLVIVYNDDPKNVNVTAPGKVKRLYDWKDAGIHALMFDLATGNITRKVISDQKDDRQIAMPRFSFGYEGKIYLLAEKQRSIGKDEMKIGLIALK